jgi:RNA polymerase sigma factor (sigma-70 family)
MLARQAMHEANEDPDDDLVAWTLRGDRDAFGILWDRHHRRVYGYCYRSLGTREPAEDATAETFRKALASLHCYRPGAFRSWLFSIAHNVIVDEQRRHRPTLPLELAADVGDDSPPLEEVAERRAYLDLVRDLLPRLTDLQRDVIALRLAGLDPAEIAEALDKSRPAIDMAHHRALIRLRTMLRIESPAAGEYRHDRFD